MPEKSIYELAMELIEIMNYVENKSSNIENCCELGLLHGFWRKEMQINAGNIASKAAQCKEKIYKITDILSGF